MILNNNYDLIGTVSLPSKYQQILLSNQTNLDRNPLAHVMLILPYLYS